jgi:hypothetical protein
MPVPSASLHLKLTVGLIVLLGLYSVKLYADRVGADPDSRRDVPPPNAAEYLGIVQKALEARKKEDDIFEGLEITSVTVQDEVLTLEGSLARERHRIDAREIAYQALTRAGVRIKDEGRNDHHRLKKIDKIAPDDTP